MTQNPLGTTPETPRSLLGSFRSAVPALAPQGPLRPPFWRLRAALSAERPQNASNSAQNAPNSLPRAPSKPLNSNRWPPGRSKKPQIPLKFNSGSARISPAASAKLPAAPKSSKSPPNLVPRPPNSPKFPSCDPPQIPHETFPPLPPSKISRICPKILSCISRKTKSS